MDQNRNKKNQGNQRNNKGNHKKFHENKTPHFKPHSQTHTKSQIKKTERVLTGSISINSKGVGFFDLLDENGKVIEKRSMFGNDEKSMELAVLEQSKNPTKEYIVYNNSEKETFQAVKVDSVKTPDQLSWDAIKDKANDAEKLFARILKLDA